jgi:hypothetical protein
MGDRFSRLTARSRAPLSVMIVVMLTLGVALPAGIAFARVDQGTQVADPGLLSQDVVAKATGGGTVTAPLNVVASFGLNSKRPPGFTGGGFAQGRINYDRHAITPGGRHVNVPVVSMEAETTGNTGRATISGDCLGTGAECAYSARSVLVYVEDNAEPGTTDIFRIFFCEFAPFLPDPDFDGMTPPLGCSLGVEGGTLRSGNIQVRP